MQSKKRKKEGGSITPNSTKKEFTHHSLLDTLLKFRPF